MIYLKTYESLFKPYINMKQIHNKFRKEIFNYYRNRIKGGSAVNFVLEDFDKNKYWLIFYDKVTDTEDGYKLISYEDDPHDNIGRWIIPKMDEWIPIKSKSKLHEFIQREFPWVEEAYLHYEDIKEKYREQEVEPTMKDQWKLNESPMKYLKKYESLFDNTIQEKILQDIWKHYFPNTYP